MGSQLLWSGIKALIRERDRIFGRLNDCCLSVHLKGRAEKLRGAFDRAFSFHICIAEGSWKWETPIFTRGILLNICQRLWIYLFVGQCPLFHFLVSLMAMLQWESPFMFRKWAFVDDNNLWQLERPCGTFWKNTQRIKAATSFLTQWLYNLSIGHIID